MDLKTTVDSKPLVTSVNWDTRPLRLVAVWTRLLDGAERAGRVNVACNIRAVLADFGLLDNRYQLNAFQQTSHLRSLVASAMAFLKGLISGRPLPLQCALFANAADHLASAPNRWRDADVIYLDGVRTLLLLRRLTRLAPEARIVVDLDDLMSRRFETLSRNEMPLSLGYIEALVPKWLSRLMALNRVGRLIARYERMALRRAELEIVRSADKVVLLNRYEAEMLRHMAGGPDAEHAMKIVAIPPQIQAPRDTATHARMFEPRQYRAIFVGSDKLTQNRLTIDYLLTLWSKHQIKLPLHIFGRQTAKWPHVPNVTFAGYVPDISVAYLPGSVMIYPCFVPGGIKTKVLEAFAHGVPVVGNAMTFEGISPPGYPLLMDREVELLAFLRDPSACLPRLQHAVRLAFAYCREHSPALFKERWCATLTG